jgi:hypothetical protein
MPIASDPRRSPGHALHRAARARAAAAFICASSALAALAALAGCAARNDPAHPVVAIQVTADGFVPRLSRVRRGVPVTLVVTRKTDQTCATEIVVAGLGQKWDLPLGRAVRIEIPEGVRDTLRYACGMDMFHGVVIAE